MKSYDSSWGPALSRFFSWVLIFFLYKSRQSQFFWSHPLNHISETCSPEPSSQMQSIEGIMYLWSSNSFSSPIHNWFLLEADFNKTLQWKCVDCLAWCLKTPTPRVRKDSKLNCSMNPVWWFESLKRQLWWRECIQCSLCVTEADWE